MDTQEIVSQRNYIMKSHQEKNKRNHELGGIVCVSNAPNTGISVGVHSFSCVDRPRRNHNSRACETA